MKIAPKTEDRLKSSLNLISGLQIQDPPSFTVPEPTVDERQVLFKKKEVSKGAQAK